MNAKTRFVRRASAPNVTKRLGEKSATTSRALAVAATLATILASGMTMAPDASARGRTGSAAVDCDADGPDKLQQTLDNGFDGMTINVAGTCNPVIIELSNIIIDGKGLDPARRGTITGSQSEALIRVRGSSVLIRNLTVKDNTAGSGVAAQLGSSVVLKRNLIENNAGHGVVSTAGAHAFVGHSTTDAPCGDPHVLPDETQAAPNDMFGACVQGNVIRDNDLHGVVVRLSAAADVHHNVITNTVPQGGSHGISLENGGSADVDGNDIYNFGRGISLRTNSTIDLDDDIFHQDALDPPNTLFANTVDIRCRSGGAMSGSDPEDENGSSGAVTISHSLIGCHIESSLHFDD